MPQDFSKKFTIVIRDDIASWQLTNTVGHIAAYLGNKISDSFDTGKYFTSKDGINFPRNSQFAIVALKANKEQLMELATKLNTQDLLHIKYVQEMIDMIDDNKIETALSLISSEEMDILGIGMFGDKNQVRELTSKLQLWK